MYTDDTISKHLRALRLNLCHDKNETLTILYIVGRSFISELQLYCSHFDLMDLPIAALEMNEIHAKSRVTIFVNKIKQNMHLLAISIMSLFF